MAWAVQAGLRDMDRVLAALLDDIQGVTCTPPCSDFATGATLSNPNHHVEISRHIQHL